MKERAVRAVCAGVVFVVSLALYAWTLAPTVTLVDSGELIVAASGLGVAHPPGFPLYVLLAHAATLVPIGNVAQRVHFASALFAALAAATLTLVVAEMMRNVAVATARKTSIESRSTRDRKRRRASPVAPPTADHQRLSPVMFVGSVAAGLLFAFSRTLWSYATVAEVYTLNTLLLVTILLLMLWWRRSRLTETARADRWLYGAAFLFGLALGVHHVTVALVLPALAVLVLATDGARFFTSRRLAYAAAFACAGLAIYVYLPLAAARSPVMNWGDPHTLERFWWHVTGKQYRVFFTTSAEIIVEQLHGLFVLVGREFGPWWCPLGLAYAVGGFLLLLKRDRSVFWLLLAIVLADVGYAVSYEIAEDKDAYYLPSFLAISVAAGVGFTWVALATRRIAGAVRLTIVVLATVSVPLVALASNLPYSDRSRYSIARDYIDNVLAPITPGGMLLTMDWQVYSPWLYVREIERRRRDVVVIDMQLLRRSWYLDHLGRAYPALLDRTRDEVDAFLDDLQRWERDPEFYARDASLTRRISRRFNDMILAFVSTQRQTADVYVTPDVALNPDAADRELTTALTSAYQLVPQGLVFQLFTDSRFHEPSGATLQTRGLVDGTLRFATDDVVRRKVLPVYVTMLVNRGRYLASHARHEDAIRVYRQALALDPESAISRHSLVESETAVRRRRVD